MEEDNIRDIDWLKNIINKAVIQYVNENKTKQAHRNLSPVELMHYDIVALDCSEYNSEILAEAAFEIISRMKGRDEKYEDFYCGITNDVVTRKASHESQDYNGKKIEYMIAFKCDSKKTAAEVEEFLNTIWSVSRGKTSNFANGAAPDSDFVYFYRIPK